MEIKHLTLAEADALGLPRVTYVIHSGAAARRFAPPPRPAMTATENECRYEWAYQALDDYLDAADCEDDDADAAAYRARRPLSGPKCCALSGCSSGGLTAPAIGSHCGSTIASPTQRRQNDPLAKSVTREVIAIALQGGTAHAAPAGEFAAWRAAYTGTRSPADGALALRVKALKDRRR